MKRALKKVKAFLVSLFLTLVLTSCSYLPSQSLKVQPEQQPLTAPAVPRPVRKDVSSVQKSALTNKEGIRYLIKNRTISLEVENISQAVGKVEKLAIKYGGYISSQNLSASNLRSEEPAPLVQTSAKDFLQGYLEARVPAKNFDIFSREVKKIGRVLDDVINSQEVTQEYFDLKARLKNLERAEAQYLKILEKSGKISDILAVERELERVRSDIERLRSQQMVLEKSIEMASVRVELKKEEGLISPPPEGWGFKEAWQQAIKNFVGSLNNLVIFTGSALPYLLALGFLYYLLRLISPYLNRLSLKKKKTGTKRGS